MALLAAAVWQGTWQGAAQQIASPRYRVDVELVAVPFTVVDARGQPVHGLKAADIRLTEDGVPQQIAALSEGGAVVENGPPGIRPGTSVFVLFDTSNHMYSNIPYVSDAIADLLRRLDPADAVAIYTFSRNLSRAAPLSRDRAAVRAGLAENVSAGDDTALFDCLLLTLRDAAAVPGQKVVVVFSNGRDNRSRLSPMDVGAVAVNEGIPVYVISVLDPAKDYQLASTLDRLTSSTGGKLYLAGKWQAEAKALAEIREQIAASYTAYFYPSANANHAFRRLEVKVVGRGGKSYAVRSRSGYQPPRLAAPESN
jgi:VWFA-related protein